MVEALVKFGVKDQNVVLSTVGKIKKAKADLGKKTNVDFMAKERFGQKYGAAASASKFGMGAGMQALKSSILDIGKDRRTVEQKKVDDYKKEQFENSKLVQGTKKAAEGLASIGKAAAGLDPIQFIVGTMNAVASMASGIPFLGGLAKGAAELASVSIQAAGGAVNSAKSNIPGALDIEKRNFANNYYGSEFQFSERERAQRDAVFQRNAGRISQAETADARNNATPAWFSQFETSYNQNNPNSRTSARQALGIGSTDTAGILRRELERQAISSTDTQDRSTLWTPSDQSQFIAAVSGAFGKIQKPLGETLQTLMQKGKNVEMLTQVGAGNWNALGTDEGAILQQISNSFSGALPSIKQEMQNALLKEYGDKAIAQETATLSQRRQTAGTWQRADEQHMQTVADAAQRMSGTLLRLNDELHRVELNLIRGAQSLASAVTTAVNTINP